MSKQVILNKWVSDNVPANLRSKFWIELDKWDESKPRTGTYGNDVLFTMLQYAKESK